MDRNKIANIVRDSILAEDRSTSLDMYLMSSVGLNRAVDNSTRKIADLMDEEDDLKTVLPDMKDATLGEVYAFFTETGDQLAYYWRTDSDDDAVWKYGTDHWKTKAHFLKDNPNLGHLSIIDA